MGVDRLDKGWFAYLLFLRFLFGQRGAVVRFLEGVGGVDYKVQREVIEGLLATEFLRVKGDIKYGELMDYVNMAFEAGCHGVDYFSSEYPESLRRIPEPPLQLFYAGSLGLANSLCVAVIGTRRPSRWGRREAYKVSYELGRAGYVVVSGLALGIDTIAHEAALDSNGSTIAVLPWFTPVTPSSNFKLAQRISHKGLVLSEYPTKIGGNVKWMFIERNRIISGLSRAVIVIEARAGGGGSYRTVKYALAQGKPAYILRPEVKTKDYLRIVRAGAVSVRSVEEILTQLKQ